MVRKYVFLLALMMGCLSLSAQTVTAQEQQTFEPDTVTVYGRTVTVQPFLMPQVSYTWRDMKPWLPEEITQTPDEPMSYKEIYDAVSEWEKTTAEGYEEQIDRLTREYLIAEKGEDYTEMDYDIRHKLFSDKFHIRGGDEVSEEAQEAHNKHLATLYLKDMLREAFKYERDSF